MYVTISVKKEILDMIDLAREEFLKHHPEMGEMKISKHKVVYEALNYYVNH